MGLFAVLFQMSLTDKQMFEQEPSRKERNEMNHSALFSLTLYQHVGVGATDFFYFWRQKVKSVGNFFELKLKC